MIYFDTDVLIHLLIPQDPIKHQLAKDIYLAAVDESQFLISLLCVQETAFVLKKLGQKAEDIEATLNTLLSFDPVSYQVSEMKRGIYLAKTIGFHNINDCLHTAIAETYCREIYTFNLTDFKHIQKHSKLKITIL